MPRLPILHLTVPTGLGTVLFLFNLYAAPRLYTTVIEKAPLRGRDFESEQAFIPFKGLPREERYCETLAHELAHARQSVTDPGFLPMRDRLKSMNDQVLRLQSLRLVSANRQSVKKEMQAIADQIKVLTTSIEGPAIAVERAVWRELSER
ncbi:MAG: hypothetical protein EHM23_18440 [Acidobacteria bacterium]|nr:MAG: hypothetical protein EHM23_18440 [Acidobacteriota bacterium]